MTAKPEFKTVKTRGGLEVRMGILPSEAPEGAQVAPPRTDLLPLVKQPVPPRREFILFETQEDIDARMARDLRLEMERLDRVREEDERRRRDSSDSSFFFFPCG